jgi:hypothetical protein
VAATEDLNTEVTGASQRVTEKSYQLSALSYQQTIRHQVFLLMADG